MLAIGIDTGGTCTDSVVFDFETGKLLASGKAGTTHERLERGIEASLSQLPEALVKQAELLSLSTTLATNACVEHKGGRVLLIFIGASEKVVRGSYRDYGFEGTDFMLFVPGNAKEKRPPDWAALRAALEERLPDYDSVAVSQMNAEANGGAYEKQTAELVKELRAMPVVCAYGLFQDRNVIRRGAGALLNARLLPVIDEFLTAIHCCLETRGLRLPIVIMRSDGSLMSEAYAAEHPVETLLCGPAASAKGAMFLGKGERALILDMGGTTTDIALVKGGQLQRARTGIQVGEWNTFVKGLDIDTFGLGGDSELLCREGILSLSTRRVIPLSALAQEHPEVTEKLKALSSESYPLGHSLPLHCFYTLVKDLRDDPRRSAEEKALCAALSEGPLSLSELAAAVGRDVYSLNTRALEREGVLLRSALTPTDMMCLKGDLDLYDPTAARLAADFFGRGLEISPEKLAERVYELVEHKLYRNILRVLLKDRFSGAADYSFSKEVERLVEESYRISRENRPISQDDSLIRPLFQTDALLIGVGAPIHVFLPQTARLLGTDCLIPEAAGVTNALGALIGDVRGRCCLEIREELALLPQPELLDEPRRGFQVTGETGSRLFPDYPSALAFARAEALRLAEEKALRQGARRILRSEAREETTSSQVYGTPLFLSTQVIGEAVGELG